MAEYHLCSVHCQRVAQQKGNILDMKKCRVMQTRYGVDNPQQLDWVREKSQQTNIERYGCIIGSQSDVVKEKTRQTNLERYGVDWHTQSQNFVEKSKQTWIEHYGVDHPMRSDVVKQKYDFKENWRRAHQTKKSNGTYASSSVEKRFHQRLINVFGKCVEHQLPVKHDDKTWLIDFRINNVYIQFDGVYWHGLDRSITMIRESMKPRDKAIAKKYDIDREQDEWFKIHGMTLIRITDTQAKKMSDEDIRIMINLVEHGL